MTEVRDPTTERTPERDLWLAVVARAVKDARDWSSPATAEEARIHAGALRFLLRDRESFDPVAQAAGYDPDWLRERVRELLG